MPSTSYQRTRPFKHVVTRKPWQCSRCFKHFEKGTGCWTVSYLSTDRTVTVRYCEPCWNETKRNPDA